MYPTTETHDTEQPQERELPEQTAVEHAIAPGSSGPAVRELAQLLETIGKETYVSRGDNHDDVFTDELMQLVRDVLVDYHRVRLDEHELPQKLRDLAMQNAVHGDTWAILRKLAGEKEQQPAS